jgi:hypothetical protein
MVAKNRKSFGESQTCSADDAKTQVAGPLASSARREIATIMAPSGKWQRPCVESLNRHIVAKSHFGQIGRIDLEFQA